jgi:hypothetical protein
MANRRLSMRKIREVLRLKYEKGFPVVRLPGVVTLPAARLMTIYAVPR